MLESIARAFPSRVSRLLRVSEKLQERCTKEEIQHWSPDWGEQFPKGLYTHGGQTVIGGHAQIVPGAAAVTPPSHLGDNYDEGRGIIWDASAVDKPHPYGVDVVLDASPLLFLFLIPLEAFHRLTA